jgi:hypothetical protein
MSRVKVLIQRSIATPSPSRIARSKPTKMVYENTTESMTNPAIARNSPKACYAIFAAEVTAKRTIVSSTKKAGHC